MIVRMLRWKGKEYGKNVIWTMDCRRRGYCFGGKKIQSKVEKIIESRSNKIVENKKEMKIDNVGDKIVQGEMESKKEAEPVVFNGQDNELENQPWTKRKFMHFFLASFAGVGLAAFLLGSLLIYSSLPKIQPSMDPIEPQWSISQAQKDWIQSQLDQPYNRKQVIFIVEKFDSKATSAYWWIKRNANEHLTYWRLEEENLDIEKLKHLMIPYLRKQDFVKDKTVLIIDKVHLLRKISIQNNREMIQEFLNEIQILNCFKYIKVVLIGNDKDLLIDNLAGDEILSFKTKGEFVETPSKGSKSGKTNNKGKNTKN